MIKNQTGIYKFIKPDLLILVPVLFLIGNWLKKSNIKDYKFPFIIWLLGIILYNLYILPTLPNINFQEILTAVFAGFCQGILIAGASVFAKQLKIQSKKNK